ncbi:DnaJ-domain-containing protein [Rhizopogon vinicolor AM-OR11-026]|uniref:DnaJ-domain-containing protein n=1 Tax=Rhizopogon vinicolor AM-OR11-026 TaxID=1314800 RepID=A0A1B7ND98_9AGAM|nr:DnaJ-domain-containing protein [Rhizopogon vinicolor AM-OR11-026]
MSAALFRIVGWSYLPDFATKQALRVIHQISFNIFHRQPPDPRTPAYALHYRLTFAAVVLCYLIYNFLDASGSIPNNFYQLLGVYPDSNDTTLKMAFRGFARKYHPDRVGPSGESLFIEVRDAFEALKDPVVRFAYDRFGPDVLKWKECTTMREYLRRGLLTSSFYHIMTGAGLILFSAIGKPSPIAAWRYLLFLGLFASELYLLLAPSPSALPPSAFVDVSQSRATVLDILFPKRIVHQHILLLHQIFFFLSIALSRVAPVIFPSLMRGDPAVDQRIVLAMGERLGSLAKTTERELSIMLDMEMHAIHETPMVASQTSALRSSEILNSDTMRVLAKEMEDVIVEDMLKSKVGPVKTAWDAAIGRERRKRAEDWRLREIADKLPSPPPETYRMKIHHRARSLSM